MKIGRKGFEKGVHGETKNAGVRTQKRGRYLGKNHAPLLQVKWLVPNYNFEFVDTTEGGTFYNGTRRRMFRSM